MSKHASGLTASQAKKLLGQYGFNEINSTGATSAWNILWRQIKGNFIIYLLVVAMIISFAVGKGLTSYTILTVILMVIGTSFVQEYKAEKAIEYLKKIKSQKTRQVKNNSKQSKMMVKVNDDDDGGARDKKISWLAREDNAMNDPRLLGVVLISGR